MYYYKYCEHVSNRCLKRFAGDNNCSNVFIIYQINVINVLNRDVLQKEVNDLIEDIALLQVRH